MFLACLLVGGAVDYSRDCAYRFAIVESHERLCFAEIKSRVSFGAECGNLVYDQRRYVAGIVAVEVDGKLHILAQLVMVGSYGVYVD